MRSGLEGEVDLAAAMEQSRARQSNEWVFIQVEE